jgi:arsenical-resistance protein 2
LQDLVFGAINLPAQTFYLCLPTLVPLLKPVPTVIFYCNSSAGRGPRCAGWYADALEAVVGPENMAGRVKVLDGGITAWNSYQQYNDEGEVIDGLPVMHVTG